MELTLPKKAQKELKEILQKQFSGIYPEYPDELIDDLGLTLLGLTVLALKRQFRINKQKDTLLYKILV